MKKCGLVGVRLYNGGSEEEEEHYADDEDAEEGESDDAWPAGGGAGFAMVGIGGGVEKREKRMVGGARFGSLIGSAGGGRGGGEEWSVFGWLADGHVFRRLLLVVGGVGSAIASVVVSHSCGYGRSRYMCLHIY